MTDRQKQIMTYIALGSGLVLAVALWFALTRYTDVQAPLAAAISALVGGLDYFFLRYLFSRTPKPPQD